MAASKGPDRGSKLTLSFGLVSIPIRYKPLYDDRAPVSGKLLCPAHRQKASQVYQCGEGTDDEHLLKRGEMVTAYPHPDDPNELVVMDKAVVDEFAEQRTGSAEITRIVDASVIRPALVDKTHMVWAEPDSPKSDERVNVFAAVLRDGGKAAVCTTVLSGKTRMILFEWDDEFGLVAHVMRFRSHIRLGDAELSKGMREAPSPAEFEMASQLFAVLEDEFDPTEVEDGFTPLMQDAIRQTAKGGTVTIKKPAPLAEAPGEDLLAALNASVEAAKQAAKKKPAAAKKPATRARKTPAKA